MSGGDSFRHDIAGLCLSNSNIIVIILILLLFSFVMGVFYSLSAGYMTYSEGLKMGLSLIKEIFVGIFLILVGMHLGN